jgi:hypothetical protein
LVRNICPHGLGQLSHGGLLAGADQQHHGDQQFGFAEPVAANAS